MKKSKKIIIVGDLLLVESQQTYLWLFGDVHVDYKRYQSATRVLIALIQKNANRWNKI